MRVNAGNKTHGRNAARMAKRHAIGVGGRRMRDVPNVEVDEEFGQGPEAPYAERKRSSLSHPSFGKNGSSDGTQEAENFG